MERCVTRNIRKISPQSPLYRIATTITTPTPIFAHSRIHTRSSLETREPYNKKQEKSDRSRLARLAPGTKSPRAFDLANMTTDVALATVPSADTPATCILLRHEKGSYLFGRVAEGTQRAMVSRKMSIAGITNVFLSGSVGWDQIGGLPGLLLTIGGVVSTSREAALEANRERERRGRKLLSVTMHNGVNIHAGENISHALATQRGIIPRQPVKATVNEHRKDPRAEDATQLEPDWQDDFVKVWKVPVTRERSSSPRKRMRLDDSEQGEEFKESNEVSDPEVAKFIVEEYLFNGTLPGQQLPLVYRKVSEIKPEDIAIVFENGTPRLYRGPIASDGADVPNADDEAWVWTPPQSRQADPANQRMLPMESTTRLPLPRTSYSQTSLSYIVKTSDRRGKFDVKAAEALNVPRQMFSKLTKGLEVKNNAGETVKPEQVLGESIPGKGVIIADISGPDFVGSFVERPEWSNKELMANIAAIYWLLAPGLSTHPKIKKMMDEYPTIRHIICSEDACPNRVTNQSPAELQMRLRRIDPARYPVPKFQNKVDLEAPAADSNIQFARPGARIHLMPRLLMDDEQVPPFPNLQQAWEDVPENVLKEIESAVARSQDPALLERIEQEEKDIPSRDAEITCLGTGSSAPSKYRNVSGTLIRAPGIGNYLLDCGEGTLGQLHRLYGKEETAAILRDLKCIVISHLHADHHLGATSIFRAWYEQTIKDGSSAKLAVSCIDRYREILAELSQIEDFGFHRLVFPMCTGTDDFPPYKICHAEEFNGSEFGLNAIKHIKVSHCWRSLAQEIELTSGLRIAYSGDCRPSAAFAEHCLGAHLLVHECTFGDDMIADAKKKNHSTVSGALGVAKDMQARRTLLTHFSQRYVKADVLKTGENHGVLMGTDFMTVKLGDFQKGACFVPAVQKLMEILGGDAEAEE